jgi:putative ABC transport system permease protein
VIADVLWRVVLRSIRRRPFQSSLFVAGVALGVAMIVAIDLANSSALRAFGLFTESIAGRTTHQITRGAGGLPEDVYRQIRVDLGIRSAAPVVSAYVQAIELDEQPLRVFGVDPFAEAPFRGYLRLEAGNSNVDFNGITAFLTQPNTALIAEPLAALYKLKQGDTITVRYGPARHTVTIAGLLRPTDDVSQQGLQDLLITDISTAQELLGMTGRLSSIDLIVPEGAAGDTLLAKIQAILPLGAVIETAAARSAAISQMTGAFNLSLAALSLLALVVGMFLIYNTVTFSVVQRRPILGTLRALGVTRRQIFAMILWEAALLSAVGAVIGLVAGVLMGRAAVVLVTRTITSLYFTVTVRDVAVPVASLVKGALIGVGAALFAALLPAYEATTTPPSGTLRRSDIEAKVRRLVPRLTVAGLIVVVLSFAALSFASMEIGFAGLFGIVIGFSLITPLVALFLMTAIRPFTGALLGVLGLMAPRSIIRSLSRTSVAVAALMVAVSVIVGVSAMVGSFRNNVEDWLSNTIRADILISPPSIAANWQDVPVDPSVADQVAHTPGVAEVSVARNVLVSRPGDPLPVRLTAYSADISQGHRRFVWAIGDFDAVWQAMGDGAVIVTESFARHRGIAFAPGQSLILVTDRGDKSFPVAAIQIDYGSDQGTALMRLPIYRQSWDDRMISTMGVFVEPGVDIGDVINRLREKFAGWQELQVRSNRELRDSVLVIFDQTFAITTALNLLATVVAFIGILSALMALQLERTREIGTMRANGLTRRQLFRLTLLETGLMGAIAGLMSLPVGTALAWVLVYIINVRSFGWSLQLQLRPEFYAQAVVIALVAALLAGVYPAIRMGRIQPAEAVRSE